MSLPDWETIGIVVGIVSLAAAIVYYLMRARCALDTVRVAFQQSVTDRMIAQVRWFADNPRVAREVFPAALRLPDARIPAFMCAHVFLLHFENVITQRKHLAKGDYDFHTESMRQIFRQAPVLHEWMAEVTPGIWSDELRDIAARNRPPDLTEEGQS